MFINRRKCNEPIVFIYLPDTSRWQQPWTALHGWHVIGAWGALNRPETRGELRV